MPAPCPPSPANYNPEPMTHYDVYEITPDDQYPAPVDFEPAPGRVPFNGAVKRMPHGFLWMYWMPQGRNYRDQYDDLVGWYQVPLLEELEQWAIDSTCPTPAEDDLEPDHPDSWLRLLGLV
jgi:hypothetical protein